MSAPKDLLEYLVERFQEDERDSGGEVLEESSALDDLDKSLVTHDERLAARKGIEAFLEFSRQYLVDHPPQTHSIFAQGFGVQLAGGAEVTLVPPTVEDAEGALDNSPAYHVTIGRSIRGRGGTQPHDAFAVTGKKQEPSLRNPRAK